MYKKCLFPCIPISRLSILSVIKKQFVSSMLNGVYFRLKSVIFSKLWISAAYLFEIPRIFLSKLSCLAVRLVNYFQKQIKYRSCLEEKGFWIVFPIKNCLILFLLPEGFSSKISLKGVECHNSKGVPIRELISFCNALNCLKYQKYPIRKFKYLSDVLPGKFYWNNLII